MALTSNSPLFKNLPAQVQTDPEKQLDDAGERGSGVLKWLSHEVFRKDCLDQKLARHHITGPSSLGYSWFTC